MQEYFDLLASQHKGKPKCRNWLGKVLQGGDDAQQAADCIEPEYLLSYARGVHLDVLGVLIGIARRLTFQPSDGSSPLLDDDTYRMLLRAKIAQNHWDGKNGTLPGIWAEIYEKSQLAVRDNQDMTMTATATNLGSTPLKQELISHGYIIPKPEGVRLNVVFREILDSTAGMIVSTGAMDFGRTETEVAVWRISSP